MIKWPLFVFCGACLALMLASGSASASEDPEAVSVVRSMQKARAVGQTFTARERHLRGTYSPERLANEFGILADTR